MSNNKCCYGYLKKQKRIKLIKLLISLLIIFSIFIIGIIIFGTRNNYCTLVAVVLALPAGKFAVEYFILFPHKSIEQSLYEEIEKAAPDLLRCYDAVFSNSKKPIGILAVVVSQSHIVAFTEENADSNFFETSLQDFLKNDKLNIKATLYKDKKSFINKISNMQLNAAHMSAEDKERMNWNKNSMCNMCL